MMDAVVILSGGMDSVTLLHYLVKREKRNPAVLTFTYGQKHSKETALAEYHAKNLGCPGHLVVDLSGLVSVFSDSALVNKEISIPDLEQVQGDPQPPTYVPNRNMVFLSIAAAYAETNGVNVVYYGAQAQDMYGYWDTTSDFLERINALLSLNRKKPVRILAPFVSFSKTDVLRMGLELGIDYEKTWSCYQGGEAACGRCPTCVERLQAFKNLGLTDPLPYQPLG